MRSVHIDTVLSFDDERSSNLIEGSVLKSVKKRADDTRVRDSPENVASSLR